MLRLVHVASRDLLFNDTATTEIYTLSLHDALPICRLADVPPALRGEFTVVGGIPTDFESFDRVLDRAARRGLKVLPVVAGSPGDRKSTRLNSSHANISYAVFCLKKKQYAV